MKLILILIILSLSISIYAQEKYTLNCRKQLLDVSLDTAIAQVGTRERTGHNDGDVEKYLHSVGLSKGNPYCAAGQYYCFYVSSIALKLNTSLIPIIKSGMANSIFSDAKYKGQKVKYFPKKHDLIVWRQRNSSHGHIERIFNVIKAGWIMTIGFNTSGNNRKNQSEGEGVYIKKRNIYNPIRRMTVRGLIGFNAI
jgi:hypothetical protein